MQKKVMALCLRVQFFLANPVYKQKYSLLSKVYKKGNVNSSRALYVR